MRRFRWEHGFAFVAVALLAVAAYALLASLRTERLAAFSTSLSERSPEQLHNIQLAARRIDGAILEPGRDWSFNRTAGPYTGYLTAPAIIAGEVRPSPGGGVCQVSSTLYNAALLAGLKIVERHAHLWPVRSVPPGRDAMVSDLNADLRLRNPYHAPLTLRARVSGESLVISLWGRGKPRPIALQVDAQTVAPPSVTRLDSRIPVGTSRVQPGRPGCRCTVWRVIGRKQEMISEDFYQPRDTVRFVSRQRTGRGMTRP